MTSSKFPSLKGDKIIGRDGAPIALRGVGVGGWLNMENFITGYPANEEAMREAVARAIGADKAEFMFEKFLEHFFDEEDAAYLASLGLNCVRIPVNYRHFEDDMAPFTLKEDAFRHLDRAIAACAKYGIYTIIDLHALPGFQNQHWHSDNPTHKALFWVHRHFQDRAVWLWERIAEHYKDEPFVAGYNPINEPADPSARATRTAVAPAPARGGPPTLRRRAERARGVDAPSGSPGRHGWTSDDETRGAWLASGCWAGRSASSRPLGQRPSMVAREAHGARSVVHARPGRASRGAL